MKIDNNKISRFPKNLKKGKNTVDESWYYEDKRGLLIYAPELKSKCIVIPWAKVKKSMANYFNAIK